MNKYYRKVNYNNSSLSKVIDVIDYNELAKIERGVIEPVDPIFEILFCSINFAFYNFESKNRPYYRGLNREFHGSEAVYANVFDKYLASQQNDIISTLTVFREHVQSNLFSSSVEMGLSRLQERKTRLLLCIDLLIDSMPTLEWYFNVWDIPNILEVVRSWPLFDDPLEKQLQMLSARLIYSSYGSLEKYSYLLKNLTLLVDYRIPAYLIDLGVIAIREDFVRKIDSGYVFDGRDKFIHELRNMTKKIGDELSTELKTSPIFLDKVLWRISRVKSNTHIYIDTTWF